MSSILIFLVKLLLIQVTTYSVNSIAYFIKYLYQLCHLIFTITSHFCAYLALIFWLFSFLYTCFIDEKLEFHFKYLRKKYILEYLI